MLEAKISALESLRLEAVREILRSPGPCLTLLLPPYRPGAQAKSTDVVLKSSLKEAAMQLIERRVPGRMVADLVEPLQHMAEEDLAPAGSHWGRVIFRSTETFRQFHLTGPAQPAVTVGGCFAIRPILTELRLPHEFYILTLSKKQVGLLRCSEFRTAPVALPKDVPATLELALELEPPDHDLENRSASGGSTGDMRGVRFGTGSGRETQRTHLADFYKLVERGLREFLHARGAPLLLVGVDEDTALYQGINVYPKLLKQSIHGSPGAFSEDDLLGHAFPIIHAATEEREAKALLQARERVAPARFCTDVDKIVAAAFEGRVDRIYLDENAQRTGRFEGSAANGYRAWGEEDLLNLAAVQTILHAGQAFCLPNGLIPDGAPAAAVLRF